MGIDAVIAAISDAVASGASAVGIGSETAAGIGSAVGAGVENAGIGSALGAGEAALTGQNPLAGAEGGALGGAITGGLGTALGGSALADVGAGALGGLASAGVTGGNLGLGALQGGVIGGLTNAVSGPATDTPASGGGAASAVSTAAPTGVGVQPVDLTSIVPASATDTFNPGTAFSQAASTPGAILDDQGNVISTGAQAPAPGSAVSGAAGNTFDTSPVGNGLQFTDQNYNPVTVPSGPSSIAQQLGLATNTPATTGNLPLGVTSPSGAASASGPSSLSQFMANPSLSTAGNVLSANPGIALGALGLGYSALKANQLPKGSNALQSEANALSTQGASLEQSLNGALPAGAQASLNQASQSAKAAVRAQYAQLGLTGSTMEAEALANVDQTVAAQGFQIADQLYQQGVSESNLSAELFNQLMAIQGQQNAALTGAIGNFAGALAGGTTKTVG